MQKKGEIERFYEAFAGGMMEKDIGRIDEPIGRKLDSIIEREVRSDGQKAVTRYKVIQTTSSFSYVKLKLETGRTHQIRVHLAYIGHPLLGDDLYGGKRTLINRQALHCQQIKLTHPITQENLSIQAELPEDMQELLNRESL